MVFLSSLFQYAAGVVLGVAVLVLLSLTVTPIAQAPVEDLPAALIATSTPVVATTTLAVATTTPPTAATSTPEVIKPKPTAPATQKPAAPAATTTPPKVEDLPITLNEAIQSFTDLSSGASTTTVSTNERVRSALVNIICTTETAGPFESISGSGVIIDPRGVILTNAHIAQFLLLKDYPRKGFVQCIIRTGSPAVPRYTVEPLFIPSSWVAKNAHKIVQDNPTGNGQHDYALLRITGGVSSSVTLPAQFPFVLTSLNSPSVGTDVLAAGYAAGFLGGITVQNNLYASSAYAKVLTLFTFESNTADLFSIGGSVVAQHGSSGGAVTTTDGTLVGVIVTSTEAESTDGRDLRAVATSYIVRDFESERGKSLQDVLSSSLAAEADIFAKIYAPNQREQLIQALTSN